MSTTTVVVIVATIVLVLIIAVVAAAAKRRRRTSGLQGTFGPEYDRTVEQTGGRRDAERELFRRKAKHNQLDIRPLTAASRERYLTSWTALQTRFMDDPVLAFTEADHLVNRVMQDRGYPTDDVEEEAGLLSVQHGLIVDNYRAGHRIEQVTTSSRSDTEQVRQGMLHFRTVFEELLGDDGEGYPADEPADRAVAGGTSQP